MAGKRIVRAFVALARILRSQALSRKRDGAFAFIFCRYGLDHNIIAFLERFMLNLHTCLRCLVRTWLVGAAMSARGMQHLGQLYALNPALENLYQGPTLVAARARYIEHSHTHPHWVPLFTGILLAMERDMARGILDPEVFKGLKRTTASVFSALGDSLFSGTILVSWALVGALLLLSFPVHFACIWTLFLFFSLLAFRIASFFLGVRHGLAALRWIARLNCINWSARLKFVNSLLLAVLLWKIAPRDEGTFNFMAVFPAVAGGAFLVGRLHMPRIILCGIVFLGTWMVPELTVPSWILP